MPGFASQSRRELRTPKQGDSQPTRLSDLPAAARHLCHFFVRGQDRNAMAGLKRSRFAFQSGQNTTLPEARAGAVPSCSTARCSMPAKRSCYRRCFRSGGSWGSRASPHGGQPHTPSSTPAVSKSVQVVCDSQGREDDLTSTRRPIPCEQAGTDSAQFIPTESTQSAIPPEGAGDISASCSVQDHGGSTPTGTCKLLTYSRRAKGELKDHLLPLPDVQRPLLKQSTIFTPRSSFREDQGYG